MLNASVDVQRVLGRLRRPQITEPTIEATPAVTLRVRSRSAAGQVRDGMGSAAATAHLLPTTHRRNSRSVRALSLPAFPLRDLVQRLGHDRAVGLVVAGIILGASVASVTPGGPTGDTGGPTGDGPAPRLAVVAGTDDSGLGGTVEEDYADTGETVTADPAGELPAPTPATGDGTVGDVQPAPDVSALSRVTGVDAMDPAAQAAIAARAEQDPAVIGPFLDDGTLLKPVAVDTSVADGSDLIRTYKVKSGDTLVDIASAHGVSMMTLWWANKLDSKDDLRLGQVLKIPPTSGLTVEVKSGDTLAGLAKTYDVTGDEIVEINGLEDPNLVVGQVLVLAGAKGDPIPTPEPVKPTARSGGSGGGSSGSGGSGGGSSGESVRPPKTYSGGGFAWPAPGAGISQYFRYGHYGLDINGSTGDRIVAAASGTVTFAGWKSNGGGYQVWVAHGSGLYSTYNHMSSVSVGRGQRVSRGQSLGRMGSTGNSSGSHLHFEVWRGPVWNGGQRVNPLGYL